MRVQRLDIETKISYMKGDRHTVKYTYGAGS